MLSPMAGITDAPFRKVCFEWALKGYEDSRIKGDEEKIIPGLFINEMVAAKKIENSINKAKEHLHFDDSEFIRSAQIYCLDAESASNATKMILDNNFANHIDLNFGCPAKKVTSIGGGSAIPIKPKLYREIINAVITTVNQHNKGIGKKTKVEVSVKFRIGIDANHITYKDAARIAIDEGVSILTLHARMAKQFYGGNADWNYIKDLVNYTQNDLKSDVKVFGNGDIFCSEDAEKMLNLTKCQGITIGRGVVGRPWLFYELFTSKCPIITFADVKDVILHHLELVIKYNLDIKQKSQRRAIEEFRVFIGSYLKGFEVNGIYKKRLLTASSLDRFIDILNSIDSDLPFNQNAAKRPRVKTEGSSDYILPHGWID